MYRKRLAENFVQISLFVDEIYIFEVDCSVVINFFFLIIIRPNQIVFFFHSDNKWTKLKPFAFILIIRRPNQNVLLQSIIEIETFYFA
jgi:hypothetical protein